MWSHRRDDGELCLELAEEVDFPTVVAQSPAAAPPKPRRITGEEEAPSVFGLIARGER